VSEARSTERFKRESASYEDIVSKPPLLSGEWSPDAFVKVLDKLEARPPVAFVLISDGLSEKCVFFPAGGLRLTSVGLRRGKALHDELRAHPSYEPGWEQVIQQASSDPEKGLEELASGSMREAYKEISARIVRDELFDIVVWTGADFEYRETNPPPQIFDPDLEAVKLSLGVKKQLQEVRGGIKHWRSLLSKAGDPSKTTLSHPRGTSGSPAAQAAFKAIAQAPGSRLTLDEALVVGRRAGANAVELVKEFVELSKVNAVKLDRAPPPIPQELRVQLGLDRAALIEEALNRLINQLAAHKRLAQEYDALGEKEKAAGHLRVVGEQLKVRQDNEGALAIFQQILGMSPLAFFAREEVAELLQVLSRGPEAVQNWLRLARDLASFKLFNRALSHLRRAVELQPEEPDLRRHLIDCLLAQDRKSEAAGEYQQLGELYERLNRRPEALACYERVLELTPNDEEARLRVEIAAASAQRFPVGAALGLLLAFVALLGATGWVYQRHQVLLALEAARAEAMEQAQQGDYHPARGTLEEFEQLHPGVGEQRLQTARAVISALEAQEARGLLMHALRLEQRKELREARELYRELRDDYAQAPATEKALERLVDLDALEAKAAGVAAEVETAWAEQRDDEAFARWQALIGDYAWTDAARACACPLVLESRPEGANLNMAGKRLAEVTPARLRLPWLEPVPLRFEYEGYEDVERELDLRRLPRSPLVAVLPRKTLWRRATLGPIVSPAQVDAGKLLFVSSDQCLYLLGRGGRLAWKSPRDPVEDRFALYRDVAGPPLRMSTTALVAEESGALRRVSLESGELLGTVRLGAGLRSVGLLEERAILTQPRAVLAVDEEGAVVWQARLPAERVAAAIDVAKRRVLVTLAGGGLCVVDGASGKAYRPFPLGAEPAGEPTPAPGGALVGTADGRLVLRWSKVRWSAKLPAPLRGQPRIHRDRVYAAAGKWLVALTLEEGQELWRTELPGLGLSPVVERDRLYVASEDGALLALDRSGKVRWRFFCEGAIVTPPVSDSGSVYVLGTDFQVHALTAE